MRITTIVRGKFWHIETIAKKFYVDKIGKGYRISIRGTNRTYLASSMKDVKQWIAYCS